MEIMEKFGPSELYAMQYEQPLRFRAIQANTAIHSLNRSFEIFMRYKKFSKEQDGWEDTLAIARRTLISSLKLVKNNNKILGIDNSNIAHIELELE